MHKLKIYLNIIKKLIHNPRQCLYYLRPQKIARVIYYMRHGGVNQVSRILDERLLMGADLKMEISLDKPVKGSRVEDYPVLEFQAETCPVVSIVIPVYNQFDFTYNCLRSILKNSGVDVPYEVILADDCSTDLTVQIEKIVKNIQVVKPLENCRFLKNCNFAAKEARGEYILFLNNDTQVQENWLEPLVALLDKHPEVGMTGAKLVYPDGRLQEAGGILWKDGSAWNFGNGNNPALPEYSYVKEADYISGAAIMIRVDLWRRLGGFDERFAPAYCEDSDIAFEVRRAGYKVLFQPKSVVVHFEGQSNGTDVTQGLKTYQITNQKKFFEKWKTVLEREHLKNGCDVFLARDHSQTKKRILVIDHMVPRYDRDAGAKNVHMYTNIFAQLGMKVTFLPADFFPCQPYTSELEQAGIEVLYGNYYLKYWKEWLTENVRYFDYIYVNRPHIAIRFMPLLKEHAKGKIIYFGHDLHYLREQREYDLEKKPELLKSIERWKTIEFQLMNSADVIYVVGSYEQGVLEKEFPGKPVRNIPIFTYERMAEGAKIRMGGRENLLFVGGFNHPPNIDAVLWFAREIFPRILKQYPEIRWYVVGSNPTEDILALADDHIIITGFVSNEKLKEYYRTCRLAVVPLRYGAGVKGKVIESINEQCPLITTSVGVEGISTAEQVFEVAEADETMADSIIQLYRDTERLEAMAGQCASYINKYYTKKQAMDIILQDIQPEREEITQ